jgi:uncharacterized surface protein with fasciclin (FAS1) repeats
MRALTLSAITLGLLIAAPAVSAGDCAKRGAGYGTAYHGGPMGWHKGYGPGHAGGYHRGARAYHGKGYGYGPAKAHGKGYGQPMMTPAGGYGSGYGEARAEKAGYGAAAEAKPGDIVDIAAGAGSFDTLVEAVKAAGLVETLKGEGPFTVFAPTDEAFAQVPEADLEALLADPEALRKVLTYHVVPGKVMAADVAGLDSAQTVQGQSVAIDTSDGVKVDGANVVKTDIVASNGVIHVIDAVILPN